MHVLHTFANNDSVPYLSWFAERAKSEGAIQYSFLLLYPKPPAMMEEMQALGFDCTWIPYNDKHRKSGMLRALPLLWWHMRRIRPDIVHCNLFDDSLPGVIAAWLAGIKVRVTTKQDAGYHWMHAQKWVRMDRLISMLSTHVIAISGENRRFLIDKEGTPPDKITLVHNGIPPERFTAQDPATMEGLAQRFGTKARFPVIGTVARLIEWKGHRHLVDAARLIVRKHPKALFLFCGTGALEAPLKALVHDEGLEDHILFTGWVDRSEMASFYGILDIYMHAAILEPFGLVYAEAMMNRIPVVSTPTGAALDAIQDGYNGILVAERSGEALADGVHRLLQGDPGAMGKAGETTALEMFNFNVMWRGTVGLYQNALQQRS